MCLVLSNCSLKAVVHEEQGLGKVLWMGTPCCHKFCVLLMEVGEEGEWEYQLTPLLFLCLYRTGAGKAATSEKKENEGLHLMWSRCVPRSSKPHIFCIFIIAIPFLDLTLY